MTSSNSSERLGYLTNGELREEIAYAVGSDPTRYGPGSDRGLTKAEVVRVGEQLRPIECDLSLPECKLDTLYERVCEWAGGEYQPNAGKPWGINRENLKLIHQTVDARPPREVAP